LPNIPLVENGMRCAVPGTVREARPPGNDPRKFEPNWKLSGGVRTVLEMIRGIISGSNGRNPGMWRQVVFGCGELARTLILPD